MGYTAEFYGKIDVDPPLNPQEIEFLNKFSNSRRMNRTKGPYFVDGSGFMGQGHDEDVIDFNSPPYDQPGLWCQWVPTEDGTAIEWDGGEKFYNADEWMKYIIYHFLSEPQAALENPEKFDFLQNHSCNGQIEAIGEDPDDRWLLEVEDNNVTVRKGKFIYEEKV